MADAADAAQAEQERLAEVIARFKPVEVVGESLSECDQCGEDIPPNRNVPHDCDNYCKAVLDALTKARVWIDDVQVKSIKVVVMPPDGLGKAEVAVRLHGGHTVTTAAQLLE